MTSDKYINLTEAEDIITALCDAIVPAAQKDPGGKIRANNTFDLLTNVIELHPELSVVTWIRSEIKRLEGIHV